MRILQVTQSYYPFLERGGPAVKVRAMARGLARRGHAVTVLTADLGLRQYQHSHGLQQNRWGWRAEPSEQSERSKIVEQNECGKKVEPSEPIEPGSLEAIYLPSLASYRALTWNPAIFAYCREQLKRFDIVHIYGFYDLFGPVAARACRHFGVPYVVEPMGMFRPIVRNIALKWIYRWLLGDATVRRARRVIATSEQERSELVEQGVPANSVVVRRNGIEAPESLPPAGAFRKSWRIPDDVKIVLFLGRLVTKKSPELLLDAFADWQAQAAERSPKAVIVFAGPPESSAYQRELEDRAKRLRLERQVLFTGPLYDQAKWSAYRDADIFVLPSQNENFGNTAAEAVVCGTPVLVTDCCGIAPLMKGGAGIVVPHDREAMATGLGRLLEDRNLLDRLRRGCAEVAHELDWDEPLDETEALYTALLRENRA